MRIHRHKILFGVALAIWRAAAGAAWPNSFVDIYARFLKANWCSDVLRLQGGLLAWGRKGYPLEN